MKRPVLFLDFDDVICLNAPYGGYHAKLALDEGTFSSSQELHDRLFDSRAKQYLAQINDEFNPWFVLSTSWWWLYEQAELVEVLQFCGLHFIVSSLHNTWATPKQQRKGLRSAEIKTWLNLHPEFMNSWVVLDDKLSGRGFDIWPQKQRTYVVLCQQDVGLTAAEYAQLRYALQRRLIG